MCVLTPGGRGAVDLGKAVVKACDTGPNNINKFKFLYPLDFSIKEKISKVRRDFQRGGGLFLV